MYNLKYIRINLDFKKLIGFFLVGLFFLYFSNILNAKSSFVFPYSEKLSFLVLRNAKPFGYHEIIFDKKENGEIYVSISIELKVKLGFLTLFNYEHKNIEIWKENKLQSIKTRTNDNGKMFMVDAKKTDDGLEVKTNNNNKIYPGEIYPTSYWYKPSLKTGKMLDTQRGILVDIEVTPGELEKLKLEDGTIEAKKYIITKDLNLFVWYTEKNQLVRIAFNARGSEIDYIIKEGI